MKKTIVCILLALCMLSLTACGSKVEIGPLQSEIFSADEYSDAVDAALRYFGGFEGCTMRQIGYAGDDTVRAEAEMRELAPEQVIVLSSTFVTDKVDHRNGLEPNSTYEGYSWILVRETKGGAWEHRDHGYG